MSTYDKMYSSNSKARKWLSEQGYEQIQTFPHTRYSKDIHLGPLSFDGVCKNNLHVVFFQVKSNCKPTKSTQKEMIEMSKLYGEYVKFVWINCTDRKPIEVYGL